MTIEGIDPYYASPAVSTPPPEEVPPPEKAPETEVITEDSTGTTVDTSA